MNTIKIKIVDSRIRMEEIGYKSDGAAAIDIYALPTKNGYFDGYKTGIAVEIPEGYVGIIVPRSSTGIKGYTIRNTIGVIDSDYRGEIKLHLFVPVTQKIRIAQMLIMPCPQFNIEFVEALSETERGEGGFGSTGK